MTATAIVDSAALPWESGLDYLKTLAPAFRDNLGPPDQVEANFAKYWQKTLFLDPGTTRRIDLVRLAPGYRDLTHCCHDSVEEAYILGGEVRIDGEGVFTAGDYFWRPPGWVHHAASPAGVELVLGFEGRSSESGAVTRAVCAPAAAGTNALFPADDERALGTRGRVRQVVSRFLVWQPGPAFARGEGPLAGFDLERLAVRVLSRNPVGGQQTLLLRLAPGYRQAGRGAHGACLQALVLSGAVSLGERVLGPGAFMHRPAQAVEAPLASEGGALLYVKVDGRLDFTLA
ncbi:MAG: cupin domain-containing protein [Burkholderiales bacterium]|nr:cupin domain-containing protein [Burkholderiales bacterium]